MNSILKQKLTMRQIIKVSVIAILLFLIITEFVIFPPVILYLVSGASMEPSLRDGQKIFLLADYVSSNYQRGDIIIFVFTDNAEREQRSQTGEMQKMKVVRERTFVKRVIGLPGDSIAIRDGIISVNYLPLPKTYSLEKPNEDYGPIIVENDHYFVLGDNINISKDSRDPDVGLVAKEQIIGKIIFK